MTRIRELYQNENVRITRMESKWGEYLNDAACSIDSILLQLLNVTRRTTRLLHLLNETRAHVNLPSIVRPLTEE